MDEPGPGAPRRAPKVSPLPPEVEEALPRLIEKHVPGHPLVQAFALPGGGRPKVMARLEGMAERPLLLTIYGPGEEARLENSVAAARTIGARRAAPSYHVIAADATGATAPFRYRLATFLWGTDAASLLESAELAPEDVRSIGEAIGEGLAGFHSVDGEGFGEARLPPEERFDSLSEAIVCAGAEADPEIARMALDLGERLDQGGGISRLVHGDLTLESCIVRIERGRYELMGFCGLGQSLWFDPVYDLVALEEDFARRPLLRDAVMRTYLSKRPIFADLEMKRPILRALRRVARGGS